MSHLRDADLPRYFSAADVISVRSQKITMLLNRLRLLGAVLAAVCAVFSFSLGEWEIFSLLCLGGFVLSLIAEVLLRTGRHEKDWYQARAGAESVKTLSWKYSVGADPFFINLPDGESKVLFQTRIAQVMGQITDTVTPLGDGASPTENMKNLRASCLTERRKVYISDRTGGQLKWYSDKAQMNKRASARWGGLLISAEVIAVILAAARAFGVWDIDFAGILSAIIGAGAAWLALKQHTSLGAAYALTAAELEKQRLVLETVESEEEWGRSVADAEEAISREHTMWLASRGEVNENIS